MMEAPAHFVCHTHDYESLIRALAKRREQLGLSQLETDRRAGLAKSYVWKLENCLRGIGPLSLGRLLKVLNLRMTIESIDGEAK